MASGTPLFFFNPFMACGPGTIAAPIDYIAGTSSPVENVPVLSFDQTTQWYADFHGEMPPGYVGTTGITLTFTTACGTTTGGGVWEAAFRSIKDDAEDLDTTAHTYDYNILTISTLPSAVGEYTYDTLTFTNGADMDSVAAGDSFILRIRRAPANASDTAAAPLQLASVSAKET